VSSDDGASRFRNAPHKRAQGSSAEADAAEWLTRHGYRILARNITNHGGEIDTIAVDGDTLCFVEVKARSSHLYGPAIEAVDVRKQRKLARAASLYLVARPWDGPCRFDVLGLDPGPDGWEFTLVKDAFRLG
jgi:putative endonuclease